MEQFAANSPGVSSRRLMVQSHAGFILTGVMTILIGPLLPEFSARWSLSDAQAGNLFTTQFIGSMLGVVLSGVITARRGFKLAIAPGFGMMGLAAMILVSCSWSGGLFSLFCNGIGLGLVIPTTNLLVADANPGRPSAALNLLNFSWGIGAAVCPFVVARFVRSGGVTLLLVGLAVVAALLMAIFAFGPSWGHHVKLPEAARAPVNVWSKRLIFSLGALFFLYVGTESSIGGWVASYAKRMSVSPGVFWIVSPSFFWGALLIGRAVAPAMLRWASDLKVARFGLVLALCGVGVLLESNTTAAIAVAAGLAGFGLAPIYPITIAMLSSEFGASSSRIASVMFALAGLGGATLPWLVGLISTWFGSLKVGLFVPLLATSIMVVLYFGGQRTLRK